MFLDLMPHVTNAGEQLCVENAAAASGTWQLHARKIQSGRLLKLYKKQGDLQEEKAAINESRERYKTRKRKCFFLHCITYCVVRKNICFLSINYYLWCYLSDNWEMKGVFRYRGLYIIEHCSDYLGRIVKSSMVSRNTTSNY